jgi:hypothetical protein
MLIRTKALWALVGALFFASASLAATPLPDGSSLSLTLSQKGVQATVTPPHAHAVALEARLKTALAGASELFVVGQRGFAQEGHHYLVLAAAKPSTAHGGSGYCGAGTEDKLLLVEWLPPKQMLQLRDTMEIQSCLKTFELASDQGNELKKVLGGITDPAEIQLTWLNHPQYGDSPKSVKVRNQKFQVE